MLTTMIIKQTMTTIWQDQKNLFNSSCSFMSTKREYCERFSDYDSNMTVSRSAGTGPGTR